MKHRPIRKIITTVPKKLLYLNLPYKDDINSQLMTRRLARSIERTFYAAQLRIIYSSNPIIRQQLKDQLPRQAASMCVYKFVCSCGVSYIGRTTRKLSKRMSEHHPAWLTKGFTRKITSSILAHLIDTGHHIDLKKAFSPIFVVPSRLPSRTRIQILNTAEAIGIRVYRPELCIQKRFVQSLILPWPDNRFTLNSSPANNFNPTTFLQSNFSHPTSSVT